MEIPAWLFISFWAVISITSLHLGFICLDKTELSLSVPPVVMFIFKHSLAVSSCFSSSYALKFRAQSTYSVRSDYVLLVYVFFSFISPGTIEGMFIWHVLKAIFACLVYFLSKLKFFFGIIFRFPTLLFLSVVRFCWKIFPVISLVIVTILLYYLPYSSILSIIYSEAALMLLGIMIFEMVFSGIVVWLAWATAFLWLPVAYFVNICSIILCCVGFSWFLCVYSYKFVLACKNNFNEVKTRSGILLMLEISLFFASATKRDFSPILALSISHWICVSWAGLPRVGDDSIVSGDPFSDGLFRIAARFTAVRMEEMQSMVNVDKAKKFFEFAVGMMGALLFQTFFKITSFGEVVAFLYLAVTWLANLVLMGFCGDFGVFNFLLANVVVGCTVGQFGLHGATWRALGAALLLYALRLKLESFSVVYREGQQIRVSLVGDDPPQPQPQRLPV